MISLSSGGLRPQCGASFLEYFFLVAVLCVSLLFVKGEMGQSLADTFYTMSGVGTMGGTPPDGDGFMGGGDSDTHQTAP
ncbi:MAG: hypothetical protein KDD70_08225 [Bdellovibrionales bacterium]|nr:hypothetical protein [Bdellovibrionales bacterium]